MVEGVGGGAYGINNAIGNGISNLFTPAGGTSSNTPGWMNQYFTNSGTPMSSAITSPNSSSDPYSPFYGMGGG